MIYVTPGSFPMGSADAAEDEIPVHTVTIPRGFYMGKHEVTFDEYDRFCVATGAAYPDDEGWGKADRPVINVSWEDAVSYARWLSMKSGASYRLPTEAEWEYVARAGTTTDWSFGNDERMICRFGNSADASTTFDWYHALCSDDHAHTAPVGT